MLFRRYISTLIFAGLAFWGGPFPSSRAQAQPRAAAQRPGAASAQGELTVTLTVVASVGIVIDAGGQPRLIVANAADPADNVSSLRQVRLQPVTAAPTSDPHRDRRRASLPARQAP
jgi:hypothetical protein